MSHVKSNFGVLGFWIKIVLSRDLMYQMYAMLIAIVIIYI